MGLQERRSPMTPDQWADLLTAFIRDGINVSVGIVHSFEDSKTKHQRFWHLQSIKVENDAFACVVRGYGACELPYGTNFLIQSPQLRIIGSD